jgi:hypothetical protein
MKIGIGSLEISNETGIVTFDCGCQFDPETYAVVPSTSCRPYPRQESVERHDDGSPKYVREAIPARHSMDVSYYFQRGKEIIESCG